MHAGGRQETIGSEIKGSLLLTAKARLLAFVSVLRAAFSTGQCKEDQMIPAHAMDCIILFMLACSGFVVL